MLRRIRLYGQLATFVGHRMLEADVATAAEAVRFLLANWPELERHMADQHYQVRVGREALPLDTEPEQLHYPAGGDEIRIVPVVVGAGAAGRIIAGVALIAASLLIPGAAFGAVLAGQISSTVGNALLIAGNIAATVGVSLVLGGVAQLLTPTPKIDKDEGDPRKSFSFSGIQNTSRAGLPLPLVYGETLIGSIVVSSGQDIVQVSA